MDESDNSQRRLHWYSIFNIVPLYGWGICHSSRAFKLINQEDVIVCMCITSRSAVIYVRRRLKKVPAYELLNLYTDYHLELVGTE